MSQLQDLRKAIENPRYKVISFDIFDTLVLRPSIFPTDLFVVAGRECKQNDFFALVRKNCESLARQKQAVGEDEILYSDIYDVMKNAYEYSEDEIERLLQAELECEYSLLSARNSAQKLFYLAKKLGKKVIIVSDIYLPYSFISKMLAHCGYEGYDKLYLSSEYKMTKSTGRLYQTVIDDMRKQGVEAGEILHIGDNERSDVASAKRQGMEAMQIRRVESVANSDVLFRRLRSFSDRRCDNTFLIGFAINRLYDDYDNLSMPDNALRFISDISSVSEILIAPLVFSYAKWLVDECYRLGRKSIIFIKNEGLLLEKIIRRILEYKTPKLCVKRCTVGLDIEKIVSDSTSDVINAKVDPNMTVGDFISNFFKISLSELDLSVIRKYGYNTTEEKIGSIIHYLPLFNEIISMRNADREKCISKLRSTCPELFDENNLLYSTHHSQALRKITGICGSENEVYTVFADCTAKRYNIDFMVQFGTMSSRDLDKMRNTIERIIDMSPDECKSESDECVDICKKVYDYSDGFCDIFGTRLKYLHLDSYQFYEFMKIAFYEYKDFVLR